MVLQHIKQPLFLKRHRLWFSFAHSVNKPGTVNVAVHYSLLSEKWKLSNHQQQKHSWKTNVSGSGCVNGSTDGKTVCDGRQVTRQKNRLCTVYIGSAANSTNDFYCTHEVNVLTRNNPHCQFVLWCTVLDSSSKWMRQLSMWIISLMSISCANQNILENLHFSWQIQTLACGDLHQVIKTCLCDCKSINGSKAWPYIYPRDVCLSLHGWWYVCIHRKFQEDWRAKNAPYHNISSLFSPKTKSYNCIWLYSVTERSKTPAVETTCNISWWEFSIPFLIFD